MADKDADNLRQLLEKRLSEAETEAIRNGGLIPDSTLSELTRLAQLIDLREKLKPPAWRQRWSIAVVFGDLTFIGQHSFIRARARNWDRPAG